MNTLMGHRWYVVRTQPHSENKASAHLGRQGFETYLPRYLKRRRHARRVETVQAALFPCYLFVAIDTTDTTLAVHQVDDRCQPSRLQGRRTGAGSRQCDRCAARPRGRQRARSVFPHALALRPGTRFASLTAPLPTALGCSRV